jgi:putative oxidoreductase
MPSRSVGKTGGIAMSREVGLLFVRVTVGLMMAFGHGWGKMVKVVSGDFSFADPLGIGAAPSLVLAALAEFAGALLVALGVKTRFAAVPVTITMVVAAFVQHLEDPWGKKELALLYAIPFAMLVITGGGRYSLDRLGTKK